MILEEKGGEVDASVSNYDGGMAERRLKVKINIHLKTSFFSWSCNFQIIIP